MVGNRLSFYKADLSKDALQVKNYDAIKQLYKDAAKEIDVRAKRLPKNASVSNTYNRNRLAQLQSQIDLIIDELSRQEEGLIRESLYTVSDQVVTANREWLSSLGFIEKGLEGSFIEIPQRVVERLVSGDIYEGGWNLSDAIWGDNELTKRDLYTIVAQGLVQQDDIFTIASQLETYVNPSKAKRWNLTMKDGRKIYKSDVDYNAQRLARTLVQHSYQQSVIETTQDNPFIQRYIWRATGSRPCPICKERDGKTFEKGELPMDHPNGMCTIDMEEDPNLVDNIADWINAEDGTYSEIDAFAEQFGYTRPGNNDNIEVEDEPNYNRAYFEKNNMLNDMFSSFKFNKKQTERFYTELDGADEDYRRAVASVLDDHIQEWEYLTGKAGSSYSPFFKAVNFNKNTSIKRATTYNGENQFRTLFHELGHAIDHKIGLDDITRISSVVSTDIKDKMLDDIALFNDRWRNEGDFANNFIDDMFGGYEIINNRMSGLEYRIDTAGIQDVLGGLALYDGDLANNLSITSLKFGHSDKYWKRSDITEEAASELFAHLSSASASKKEMKHMEKYFPNSTSAFNKILKGAFKK